MGVKDDGCQEFSKLLSYGIPRGKYFAESEHLGDLLSFSKMRDFGRVSQI